MSEFDLTPIARLDSYRGFVFGSLAADVPDLRDHLGAATALIDIFVAPAPQQLEIVAGFSIYQTACNWKIMHENGPDAYHAPVVHNNFAQAVNYPRAARGRAPASPRPTPAGSPGASSRRATTSATATPRSGTSAAIRRRSRSMRRRRSWRSSSRPASSNGFSAAAAT